MRLEYFLEKKRVSFVNKNGHKFDFFMTDKNIELLKDFCRQNATGWFEFLKDDNNVGMINLEYVVSWEVK